MAIQDQQQDAVLKRVVSPLTLLAFLCGIGSGGVIIFRFCVSSNVTAGEISGIPNSLSQIAATSRVSFQDLHGASTDFELNKQSPDEFISPGLPPATNFLVPYNSQKIQARIAAVENGSLYGDTPAIGRQTKAVNHIRTDSPAIGVKDGIVSVHVQRVMAALTLDPVQFSHQVAILSFPPDEMYRIELPINGAGAIIDDTYVAPGGTMIVGSGSRMQLHSVTEIHLRPAEPIRPPLGSG